MASNGTPQGIMYGMRQASNNVARDRSAEQQYTNKGNPNMPQFNYNQGAGYGDLYNQYYYGNGTPSGGQRQELSRYSPPMMNGTGNSGWQGGQGGYSYNLPNNFGPYIGGYGSGQPANTQASYMGGGNPYSQLPQFNSQGPTGFGYQGQQGQQQPQGGGYGGYAQNPWQNQQQGPQTYGGQGGYANQQGMPMPPKKQNNPGVQSNGDQGGFYQNLAMQSALAARQGPQSNQLPQWAGATQMPQGQGFGSQQGPSMTGSFQGNNKPTAQTIGNIPQMDTGPQTYGSQNFFQGQGFQPGSAGNSMPSFAPPWMNQWPHMQQTGG